MHACIHTYYIRISIHIICTNDFEKRIYSLASMCATVDRHISAIEGVRLGLERFPGHVELTTVLNKLESTLQNDAADTGNDAADTEKAEEKAEGTLLGALALQDFLEEAGGDRPMSQSFADLIVRGRQLFRALPREEREDVYKVLTHGNGLLSKMVRDACAVTVQCAIRSHVARCRCRAHPEGSSIISRQASLSSVGSGSFAGMEGAQDLPYILCCYGM